MRVILSLCFASVLLGGACAVLSYTNATLPTKEVPTEVEVESTGKKLTVLKRQYNVTENVSPFISCSYISNTSSSTVHWTWENGTSLDIGLAEQDAPVVQGNTTTSKLVFGKFTENGASIVGKYKCTIESSTYRYPVLHSAPMVKMSDKDYRSSMEGDTMTQTCSVAAYPSAVITWSRNNQTLTANDRINFGADNATLSITNLKQDDAGLYVCTASNEFGRSEAYIKLRVKDRLAALWPFLGILAEVIILVVIILLYEKKRAAQKRSQEEPDAADANKTEERNANDSDVRHRPVKT